MESAVTQTASRKPRRKLAPKTFTPLAVEARSHLPTEDAAHQLNKAPQTLRVWAMKESGPIRPHRIPGCSGLLWPVADIRRVLGLEVTA